MIQNQMPMPMKKPTPANKPAAAKASVAGKPGAPVTPNKKAPQPINLVRGMKDILPTEQPMWEKMRAAARGLANAYGFERIDTPILEETALFARGVGKATDIVEKEMYSFETTGNEMVTL